MLGMHWLRWEENLKLTPVGVFKHPGGIVYIGEENSHWEDKKTFKSLKKWGVSSNIASEHKQIIMLGKVRKSIG